MFNLNSRKQNFGFLIKILITKYDFLGHYSYCIFISNDQILLTIIKINKFNHNDILTFYENKLNESNLI